MLDTILVSTALTASLLLSGSVAINAPTAGEGAQLVAQKETILAEESLDLGSRYPTEKVSETFKENILIALNYLAMQSGWREDNSFVIALLPGEMFAFHKNILLELRDEKIITQKSGFMAKDGYKTIAGLPGNGVCHLASLMNWVAAEAGLAVIAPTNHNFAAIPGIEKKYGTSIKFLPGGGSVSEKQNLYFKNNQEFPVQMVFKLEGDWLFFSILR